MYVLTLRRSLTPKVLDSAVQALALDSEDSPRMEDYPTGYHEHTSLGVKKSFMSSSVLYSVDLVSNV